MARICVVVEDQAEAGPLDLATVGRLEEAFAEASEALAAELSVR
jgi:hypothetical protein